MPTTTNRDTAPPGGGSVDHRLARLLDTPFFSRVVPHLAPETLHQLVQYRGLEACGEIVTSAAACICNLGLECWPARWPAPASQPASSLRALDAAMPPDAFLVDHDLLTAFEVGWSVLYQDVSLFAADQLASTLADLHCVDADTRRGLRAFGRTLEQQRKAGTPWLARDAADVLAVLDMTAWISLLGLLDECPILAATLTAVLERRATSVSPTAFEFISTTAQIGDIRLFMRTLPGLLSG